MRIDQSVGQLKLKVGRAADRLRSVGSLQDSTARKVGWCTDRLDSFYTRLSSHHESLSLTELRTQLKAEQAESVQSRNLWLGGATLAIGAAAFGIAVAAPVIAVGALAVAGGGAIAKAAADDGTARAKSRLDNDVQKWLFA